MKSRTRLISLVITENDTVVLDERVVSARGIQNLTNKPRYPDKERAKGTTPIKDSNLAEPKTTLTGDTDTIRYISIKPYVEKLDLFEEFPNFEEETIDTNYQANRLVTLMAEEKENDKKKKGKTKTQEHTLFKRAWKRLLCEEWDANLNPLSHTVTVEEKVGDSQIHKQGKELLFFGDIKTRLNVNNYLGQMLRYANVF